MGIALFTTFFVLSVPPVFSKSPGNQTIAKGQTASFPCSVSGDPDPLIKWYKSQDPIGNDLHFRILPNGTLVINSVSEQDSGWFTCRATNDAGTEEKRAYLLVAGMGYFILSVTVRDGMGANQSGSHICSMSPMWTNH